MTQKNNIFITEADPREPSIQALIAALDDYMLNLYPSESTHRTETEILASESARFYSATLANRLCGCGAILLKNPDYAEVKRVFVSPEARGHGVGRKILQKLETSALSLGRDTLRLETGIYQPEALSLFSSFGFIQCKRFGDYPVDDPNSVFMEKSILI